MDKEDVGCVCVCVCVCVYAGKLLSNKKKKRISFVAKWMTLSVILSEVSHKDKYHMISLICGI